MDKKMTHQKARRYIQQAGGIRETDREALDRHLAACPGCRKYAQQYSGQVNQVESQLRMALHDHLDPFAPPRALIARQILARKRAQTMQKRLFSLVGAVILLAMVALALTFSPRVMPLIYQKPVNLRFVYVTGTVDYQPLADAFHQQHPNITITLVPVTRDDSAVANFNAQAKTADVLLAKVSYLDNATKQRLLPLDRLLSVDKTFPRDGLFSGSLAALTQDGKLMGLPAGLQPMAMFYDPQKFTQAGIQPPGPDWTLDDFLRAAVAINNQKDPAKFTYGFCSNPSGSSDVELFIYLFGGGFVNNEHIPTSPTLNRPENIDALTWYTSLKTDYHLMPDVSSFYQMVQLVAKQNCGFWLDSIDREMYGGTMYGLRNEPVPADMLPLPGYKAAVPEVGIQAYWIMDSTQNPQAAWQWARFLMEQPSAAGGLLPPLKSKVLDPSNPYGLSADVLAVARRIPEDAVFIPQGLVLNQAMVQMNDAFFKAAIQVFNGQADAQTALNLAQDLAKQGFK